MKDVAAAETFRRSRAAVAASFATHAAITGTLGPWIPQLKQRSGLDDGGLGLALTGYAVGLVAGTRIAGPALRRAGPRRVVRGMVPALTAGLAILPLASGLGSLAGIFALVGLASGVLDVAMNTEAVAVEERFGRRLLSTMHGTWSVSMLAGAAVATVAIAGRVPISAYLPGVALSLAAASFPVFRWLPARGVARPRTTGQRAAGERSQLGRVLLLCVVAFAAFLTEGTAAEWSAVYLREAVGAGVRVAGFGVVGFSAGMTASRFAGDRMSNRFGASTLVAVGASAAAVALGIAVTTGNAAVFLAAVTVLGLGLGPAVPMAFGAAGRLRDTADRSALAVVVTAGYVGSIVGPLAVGFTGRHTGLRTAFLIPAGMCVAAAVASGAIGSDSP